MARTLRLVLCLAEPESIRSVNASVTSSRSGDRSTTGTCFQNSVAAPATSNSKPPPAPPLVAAGTSSSTSGIKMRFS
eukprot:363885-Chlamydomonas_euryale.AAC.15